MTNSSTTDDLRLPDCILLEGIVTTLCEDGSPHVAPMGPIVDAAFSRFLLRPYATSTTCKNLRRTGEGVLHVTDDVELFARAAVGQLEKLPRLIAANTLKGAIIADACRWFEFRVESIDESSERLEIVCSVVDQGRSRDFFGFNRAKHAVIEAAILATRIQFLEINDIFAEMQRLAVIVDKTGSHKEQAAFAFLRDYLATHSASDVEAGIGRQ
jgi:uncharacterized protein